MCDLDTFHAFPWVSSNPVQMKRCRELKPNAMHLHLYQIHNRYEKQRLLKSHTYVWNVDRRPTDSCLVYTYLKIMKNDQQSWENIFSMIQGYFLLSVSSLSEAPFTVQHIYLINPPPQPSMKAVYIGFFHVCGQKLIQQTVSSWLFSILRVFSPPKNPWTIVHHFRWIFKIHTRRTIFYAHSEYTLKNIKRDNFSIIRD